MMPASTPTTQISSIGRLRFCGRPLASFNGVICLLAASTCALLNAGCGSAGYYPVTGRITDLNGQPIEGLEGAQVVFSSPSGATSSIGEVQKDGSFEMMTDQPGDGVPPGQYEVQINRKYLDPERAAPQVIDSRYESFYTSGLTATVEAKKNHFEFKVARVKGGK